jgi:hypothetical protein
MITSKQIFTFSSSDESLKSHPTPHVSLPISKKKTLSAIERLMPPHTTRIRALSSHPTIIRSPQSLSSSLYNCSSTDIDAPPVSIRAFHFCVKSIAPNYRRPALRLLVVIASARHGPYSWSVRARQSKLYFSASQTRSTRKRGITNKIELRWKIQGHHQVSLIKVRIYQFFSILLLFNLVISTSRFISPFEILVDLVKILSFFSSI